jgi:ribosomal protein S18 acetylase RimI-like enzyme
VITTPTLTYRTIDPEADASLAIANHWDACVASFGSTASARYQGATGYLNWLRTRVEEYPDGHVLAYLENQCVGQLELQVPYGASDGYVNLYHVREKHRGKGIGRLMHDYVERYCRSWEANRIELHVSPTNQRAMGFYRGLGYRLVAASDPAHLWRMAKALS